MSNKKVVEMYMDGFRATDHAKILSCLADDVVWDMPGFFYHEGKEAFDKEIENPNADGHPDIHITRLVEEGNIVVAEGTVKAKMKDGTMLDAVFCDVFHFSGDKISKLTTYLMFNKQP
jgi:ketosteroid isomerase-like protein